MKIKKNTFSTLVLELFFPTIANCKKLKIQKSTSPNMQAYSVRNTCIARAMRGNMSRAQGTMKLPMTKAKFM
jgi:hypothetical protein